MGTTPKVPLGQRRFSPQSDIFIDDITILICNWHQTSAHAILAINANQDIYSGGLACHLAAIPISLRCLFHDAIGKSIPNMLFHVSVPILTVFGSPGCEIGHGMCFPYWYGVGDHSILILESLQPLSLVVPFS